MSTWWFQPIWKILVKLDHFPRDRGENKKLFETTSQMLFLFVWKPNDVTTSFIGISDLSMILTLQTPRIWQPFANQNGLHCKKDWKINGKFTQCTRRWGLAISLLWFWRLQVLSQVHLHHLNSNRLGKSVLLSEFARLQLHRFLSATHDSMIVCFFRCL